MGVQADTEVDVGLGVGVDADDRIPLWKRAIGLACVAPQVKLPSVSKSYREKFHINNKVLNVIMVHMWNEVIWGLIPNT